MRKFKGTPGEFTINIEPLDQTVDIQIIGNEMVLMSMAPWLDENPDFDECMENAHMFAASPDLLAALQQLVEIYDCTDGRIWTTSSKRRALDAAHSAIKKALGE